MVGIVIVACCVALPIVVATLAFVGIDTKNMRLTNLKRAVAHFRANRRLVRFGRWSK